MFWPKNVCWSKKKMAESYKFLCFIWPLADTKKIWCHIRPAAETYKSFLLHSVQYFLAESYCSYTRMFLFKYDKSFIHLSRKMITDIQLAIFSNVLGVSLFLIVIIYHYISSIFTNCKFFSKDTLIKTVRFLKWDHVSSVYYKKLRKFLNKTTSISRYRHGYHFLYRRKTRSKFWVLQGWRTAQARKKDGRANETERT